MDGRRPDALGLSPAASVTELKAAFRARALTAHPDRGGDPETFRRLVSDHRAAVAAAEAAERRRRSPFLHGAPPVTSTRSCYDSPPVPRRRSPNRRTQRIDLTDEASPFAEVLAAALADA